MSARKGGWVQMTGSRLRQRVFKYGSHEIADAAGVPYRTVKDHREKGFLHPESLRSVALYVAGCLNKTMASERDVVGVNEEDGRCLGESDT